MPVPSSLHRAPSVLITLVCTACLLSSPTRGQIVPNVDRAKQLMRKVEADEQLTPEEQSFLVRVREDIRRRASKKGDTAPAQPAVTPAADGKWETFADGSTGRATEFHGIGGVAIPAYVRQPTGPGPFPVIVLLHGGRHSQAATVALGRSTQSPTADIIQAGWAVYSIDYLPPDYDKDPKARFPVLYHLPASGGTAKSGAEVVRRLDQAIRAGRTKAMLVVSVNGLRGNTMYCDSRDGLFPLETVIIKDLIPHVDATYRTESSRARRAVEGFSMGGFGAAHLGFKYPELFGVISIQAPALLGPELKQPRPTQAWSRLFPSALGGDLEYWQANDPFALIPKNADALRDRTLIRIACHVEDYHWLAPQCERLHQVLLQNHIPHAFFYFSNVKSHNRVQVLDSLGDSALDYFSSTLPRP